MLRTEQRSSYTAVIGMGGWVGECATQQTRPPTSSPPTTLLCPPSFCVTVHGLHTPRFTMDESVLKLGAALHTALASQYLEQWHELHSGGGGGAAVAQREEL